jgi:lipopolysaccharide biosynthesis protein
MNDKIKAIAAYLPQFHPIPENDLWWGKGFTEWTNVAKAKPLFKGHWQPRLPADFGFYDLRVPEVREAQAQLAMEYGIHGFMYWHYWFGGKRIIERPFTEVVQSGKPDFPFCVCWANQTWSGTWHGLSNNEILIEQTYPGKEDYIAHFYALLDAFQDYRYIEVSGKKLVFIYQPWNLPDKKEFTDIWQNLAIMEGLNGIHFVGMHMPAEYLPEPDGFDATTVGLFERNKYSVTGKGNMLRHLVKRATFKKHDVHPLIVSYERYVSKYPEHQLAANQYPWILADWDNTPRSGKDGWIFEGASPELFGRLCEKSFLQTANKSEDEKIVVVRSWNEWGEGNYLEPDSKSGTSYLQEFKKQLDKYSTRR